MFALYMGINFLGKCWKARLKDFPADLKKTHKSDFFGNCQNSHILHFKDVTHPFSHNYKLAGRPVELAIMVL